MTAHYPLTLTTGDLIAHLRDAGLRVTPQRLVIYETLVKDKHHPTAQLLFERLQPTLPSLSQATVYNTLETMVEKTGQLYDQVLSGTADSGKRLRAA